MDKEALVIFLLKPSPNPMIKGLVFSFILKEISRPLSIQLSKSCQTISFTRFQKPRLMGDNCKEANIEIKETKKDEKKIGFAQVVLLIPRFACPKSLCPQTICRHKRSQLRKSNGSPRDKAKGNIKEISSKTIKGKLREHERGSRHAWIDFRRVK